MLDDRYYMRRTPFKTSRSATVLLLIVLVAVALLQFAVGRSSFPVDHYFALSVEGLRRGYLWQLLTFQFMHAGPIHLLVNCWAIYAFGRPLEETLGKSKFLTLYLCSGVIGGLVQSLAGVLLGNQFAAAVVGASAGALGLVAAFALLYPEQPLTILLFFIIPVSMRAKFLLIFCGLVALFGIVYPTGNVAHAAHLGGMLTGMFFARYAIHWRWQWPRLRRSQGQASRRLVKVSSGSSALWAESKNRSVEDLPPEEFLSKEVDPILDKISAYGIQSLTERERRILEAARTKMAKR